MVVLGLDPGTATTGYGVVRADGYKFHCLAYGCISTPKELEVQDRLKLIFGLAGDLIRDHNPAAVALEKLFFNKNVTSAISVGQARGVLLLAAAQAGLEIGEYTPTSIKLAVTGYGAAAKDQVQSMVRSILALKEIPRPDDAADALAIALCHHNNRVLNKRIKAAEVKAK